MVTCAHVSRVAYHAGASWKSSLGNNRLLLYYDIKMYHVMNENCQKLKGISNNIINLSSAVIHKIRTGIKLM